MCGVCEAANIDFVCNVTGGHCAYYECMYVMETVYFAFVMF